MPFNIILKNVPKKSIVRIDLDLYNLGNATEIKSNSNDAIEYFGILSVPVGIHYLQLNPDQINRSSHIIIGHHNSNVYLRYDVCQENFVPEFANEEDVCIRKGIENLTFLQNSVPFKTSHHTLLHDTLKHTQFLHKLLAARFNLGAVSCDDFIDYVQENAKPIDLKQTSIDSMDCLIKLAQAHFFSFASRTLEQEALLDVSAEFCLFYLLCALLLLNEQAFNNFVTFFSNICNTDTSQFKTISAKIAQVLLLVATYLYSEDHSFDDETSLQSLDVKGFLTYIELVHDCYSDKKIINIANTICVSLKKYQIIEFIN